MPRGGEPKKPVKPAPKAAPRRAGPAEVLSALLSALGWPFERAQEGPWVVFETDLEEAPLTSVVVQVSSELGRCLVYLTFAPAASSPASLAEAVEFTSRANSGLGDGNFEVDHGSGEVAFKVALDFRGTALDPVLARNALVNAMRAASAYGAALGRVLRGESRAAEAIAGVEA